MRAGRPTDRQTNRHTHRNISHLSGGGWAKHWNQSVDVRACVNVLRAVTVTRYQLGGRRASPAPRPLPPPQTRRHDGTATASSARCCGRRSSAASHSRTPPTDRRASPTTCCPSPRPPSSCPAYTSAASRPWTSTSVRRSSDPISWLVLRKMDFDDDELSAGSR